MSRLNDIWDAITGKTPNVKVEYFGPQKGARVYEYPLLERVYDGEKNEGELGSPVLYTPDYIGLRARSWEAYTDSDIAKILINTLVDWVVGSGLTVQSEPVTEIIQDITKGFDQEKFVSQVETRFRLHAKHTNSAYNKTDNFHKSARKHYKGILIGGDALAVYRYENGVNVQLIDGSFICNPLDYEEHEKAKNRGNEIILGVERSRATKEHVAFHIQQENGKSKRIPARGKKSGRLQAVMMYADEFRVDDVRGMPLYAASLEKMRKIDRYIEAMVGGAEERANVPYYFFKNHFSDDEPIYKRAMEAAANSEDSSTRQAHSQEDIDKAGRLIKETTQKTVFDPGIGVDIKSVESTMELRLKEFTETNFIYMCASLSIPYEVALMKYENSFSASRMASQSFQHIINVRREDFATKFYKPAYDIDLEVKILDGKIQAEGYMTAIKSSDYIYKEAYHNARFAGATVPQADPSKEVKASLLKVAGYLSTMEKETEILGSGDFFANIKKLSREYNNIMDIIPEKFVASPNPENSNAEFQEEPKAGNNNETK